MAGRNGSVRPGRRFPRAGLLRKGYARAQVDEFLAAVWGAAVPEDRTVAQDGPTFAVSPAAIRRAGFDLVLNGYDVVAVDCHLEGLENEALAWDAMHDPAALQAAVAQVLACLDLTPGQRVRRVPLLSLGYDAEEVDDYLDGLSRAVQGLAHTPTSGDVRNVVFRARRGGYDETGVDDLLDDVIDVLRARERTRYAPAGTDEAGFGEAGFGEVGPDPVGPNEGPNEGPNKAGLAAAASTWPLAQNEVVR